MASTSSGSLGCLVEFPSTKGSRSRWKPPRRCSSPMARSRCRYRSASASSARRHVFWTSRSVSASSSLVPPHVCSVSSGDSDGSACRTCGRHGSVASGSAASCAAFCGANGPDLLARSWAGQDGSTPSRRRDCYVYVRRCAIRLCDRAGLPRELARAPRARVCGKRAYATPPTLPGPTALVAVCPGGKNEKVACAWVRLELGWVKARRIWCG